MSVKRVIMVEKRLNQAVRTALLSLVIVTAATTVQESYAATQSLASVARQSYNIPSGPLGRTLSNFAIEANIALSFDPALTNSLTNPAVSGSYTGFEAMSRLLSGSGLDLESRPDGSYTLVRQTPGETTLPAISITAPTQISEGSGSYTTRTSNSATRLSLSMRQTPQSVSVITRQQMDDQGMTNIAEVLQQTPGIVVNRDNSEGHSFYARGFQVQNFQYDGLPSLSTDGGNVRDNYSITNSAIYDRIEILKGATGLLNGAGYPSAVINFVRKRPTRDFQASINASAGSWSNYRGEVDVSGPLTESGQIRGRMVAALQDQDNFIDYQTSNQQIFYGIVEGDITPSTVVAAGVDYQKNNNKGTSNGHLPAFYKDGRPITFDRTTNPADKWAYRHHETTRLFADLTHTFDNQWTIKAAVTHREYKSDELIAGMILFANTDNSIGHHPGAKFITTSKENTFNIQASGAYFLFGRTHEAVIGYNAAKSTAVSNSYSGNSTALINDMFNWDNNSPYPTAFNWGLTFDIESTEKVAYAATVLKPTDRLSVILGARHTDYDWQLLGNFASGLKTSASTKQNGKVIPYAGVTFDLDHQHTVYASYTDVFKPQAYNFDANNRQLDPLTGKSYEIGIKGAYWDNKLNASAALFKINQDNKAETDPTGALLPNGSAAYIALSGIETKGIELEVSGQILPQWQLHAGYTYSQSRDRNDKRVSTAQPESLFKLATTYRLSGALNKLTIGGNLHWQSGTYFTTVVANPIQGTRNQPAYGLVGLLANYDVNNHVKLALHINNLFDKNYYSGIGQYNTVYYGSPRNVMATMKYTF